MTSVGGARLQVTAAPCTKMALRDATFLFTGDDFKVTPNMKKCYEDNGYIVIKSLFSLEEVAHVRSFIEEEGEIINQSWVMDDGDGRKSRLCLWNHPGNDVTGMVGRCEKVVNTMESLLGGEVYHYHTKLIMKEAHTGGSFVWHQDYGYWYNNGCLFPDIATAFIAIDKCDQGNGCLKILKGSHKVGRIEHKRVGGQTGADVERVDEIMKLLPLIHVELDKGDALFFHCNVLHRSEQNHSDRRRWAFLSSYNLASNNPVVPHHHPQYTPLQKVPNSAILECTSSDMSGKWFLDPATDKTTGGVKDSDENK